MAGCRRGRRGLFLRASAPFSYGLRPVGGLGGFDGFDGFHGRGGGGGAATYRTGDGEGGFWSWVFAWVFSWIFGCVFSWIFKFPLVGIQKKPDF